MMSAQRSVAIVGAGLVGSGWALVFARAGYSVRVFDPAANVRDAFLPWVKDSLSSLIEYGLVRDRDEVLSRLTVHDTLASALDGVFYVQESVYETIEAKTKVSQAIDALIGSDTLVGSSSSGIPASKFTEGCGNRERFLIAHPVNPPHLVPVVEIVPAPWTSAEVEEQVAQLMLDVDQVPVRLSREIDGFVLNRLQGVLLNEAWALYEDGIASIEDIDATISQGLGLRWSFMGPFETIDLNAPGGIEDYAARLRALYAGMVRQPPPGPWPDNIIQKAADERRANLPLKDLPDRRAWRDDVLCRLLAFKKKLNLSR